MISGRWEMGSEFHWDDRFIANNRVGCEQDFSGGLFASGRAAMAALVEAQDWRQKTIHLPSYFCPEVTEALGKLLSIRWYADRPTDRTPDFDSLNVEPGDIVLALNHFGVRAGTCWAHWVSDNPDCVVIEDYSHDPNPSRMRESPAQYVLASLRKTMPIPDGAIIFSPAALPVPTASASFRGSLKLEAMLLKAMYLQGISVEKDDFRRLQIEGEKHLATQVSPSIFTGSVLSHLDLKDQRTRREANVLRLLRSDVLSRKSDYLQPLFRSWPEAATPFNGILLCSNMEARERLRLYLITHNVFPSVHWSQHGPHGSEDELSREIGDRLLTIPCDFRYGPADIDKLLQILEGFDA